MGLTEDRSQSNGIYGPLAFIKIKESQYIIHPVIIVMELEFRAVLPAVNITALHSRIEGGSRQTVLDRGDVQVLGDVAFKIPVIGDIDDIDIIIQMPVDGTGNGPGFSIGRRVHLGGDVAGIGGKGRVVINV